MPLKYNKLAALESICNIKESRESKCIESEIVDNLNVF